MTRFVRSLASLSDARLLASLVALVRSHRETTAELLLHLAEVDERKHYLGAAYPSLFAYCVGELRMPEDGAARKIHAPRAARRHPQRLAAIAERRLHLTAVNLLAPHLTDENADELLAAATHQGAEAIRALLARRESVLCPDVPELLHSGNEHAPEHVRATLSQRVAAVPEASALAPQPTSAQAGSAPALRVHRVVLELTDAEWELLQYAAALDSHVVVARDRTALVMRALASHVERLEKRRFGGRRLANGETAGGAAAAAEAVQPAHAAVRASRRIPTHIRREVWARDGGRCTFASAAGHRCDARERLEFDHATPVTRGGESVASSLRLRCRAHNRFEAEHVFGRGFMDGRIATARQRSALARGGRERERSRGTTAAAREPTASATPTRFATPGVTPSTRADAAPEAVPPTPTAAPDVRPWLRALGFGAAEVRDAAARCEALPSQTSLEDRVRFALRGLAPPSRRPAA